jgi:hypothetical protein
MNTSSSPQPPQAAPPPKDAVPLELVVAQVKDALQEYQTNLGGGSDALPPLSSAEFDFKTTTATTIGLTISLFIFKIGGSHEKDVVNDVTYTYSVPKPPAALRSAKKSLRADKKPSPQLKDQLVQTIRSAAAAIKTAGTVGKLPFSKLSVTIQYGVKWDGTAGATAPIQLVTLGITGEKSKNTVQSVKLVFGQ